MQPQPTEDAAEVAWAASLRPLLGVLRAREVSLLPDAPAGIAAEWCEATRERGSGWLLRLVRSNRSGPAVFVSAATRGDVGEDDVLTAGALCRLAWQLRGARGDAVAADPIDDAVHALRNALNGALMNTAVLATRSAALPASVNEVAGRIEDATMRSVQELQRLVALIETLR